MSDGLSIALYYFSYLGALGLFWPFFTLHLAGLGLSPSEATSLLALSPLMGALVPPLVGLLADARRARVWLLRVATLATLLAFTGFFAAPSGTLPLAVTTGVFFFCRAPIPALADAAAFECVRRGSAPSYGGLRLWGSIGFLVAALSGGALLETHGSHAILSGTAAVLGVAAACAWLLPAPAPRARPQAIAAWIRLLKRREMWILLGAVVLAQAAGAAYDAGFSFYLVGLGFGPRFVGFAWAVGVLAEIGVLAWSAPLVDRFGAPRLFALSIATAAARWLWLSQARTAAPILLSQPLHGITFGLFYVSAVTLTRDHAGSEAPTAGQGLVAGALGLGSVIGMCFCGALFERGGGQVLYRAAALVAALGAGCACLSVRGDRRRTPPRQ